MLNSKEPLYYVFVLGPKDVWLLGFEFKVHNYGYRLRCCMWVELKLTIVRCYRIFDIHCFRCYRFPQPNLQSCRPKLRFTRVLICSSLMCQGVNPLTCKSPVCSIPILSPWGADEGHLILWHWSAPSHNISITCHMTAWFRNLSEPHMYRLYLIGDPQ